MAAPLVPDGLRAAISHLLPPALPKPKGGRARLPDRMALAGILFVLRTGIQWRDVPAEMGCSGKTCWRRLAEARRARSALGRRWPGHAARPDAEWGQSPRQPDTGPHPRRRASGWRAPRTTAPPAAQLHADKGYDHRRCRRECRARGIVPRIARRGIDSNERLGRHRRKVERTLAWLAQFRRLAVRHERRPDVHLALATLATAVICMRQIRRFCH